MGIHGCFGCLLLYYKLPSNFLAHVFQVWDSSIVFHGVSAGGIEIWELSCAAQTSPCICDLVLNVIGSFPSSHSSSMGPAWASLPDSDLRVVRNLIQPSAFPKEDALGHFRVKAWHYFYCIVLLTTAQSQEEGSIHGRESRDHWMQLK